MRKNEKQPEDHVICPKCDRPYGFTRCRITMSDGSNQCLACGVEQEKHERLPENKAD